MSAPAPRRVQLRRSRGWRMPENARKVDRSTSWGNPFADDDRAQNVARFEAWIATQPALVERARAQLTGRDLACWCAPDSPCHADVWLRLLNPSEL